MNPRDSQTGTLPDQLHSHHDAPLPKQPRTATERLTLFAAERGYPDWTNKFGKRDHPILAWRAGSAAEPRGVTLYEFISYTEEEV